MTALTKAQRQRLIRAHRIERAENVFRVDFSAKPEPAPQAMATRITPAGKFWALYGGVLIAVISLILAMLKVAK